MHVQCDDCLFFSHTKPWDSSEIHTIFSNKCINVGPSLHNGTRTTVWSIWKWICPFRDWIKKKIIIKSSSSMVIKAECQSHFSISARIGMQKSTRWQDYIHLYMHYAYMWMIIIFISDVIRIVFHFIISLRSTSNTECIGEIKWQKNICLWRKKKKWPEDGIRFVIMSNCRWKKNEAWLESNE